MRSKGYLRVGGVLGVVANQLHAVVQVVAGIASTGRLGQHTAGVLYETEFKHYVQYDETRKSAALTRFQAPALTQMLAGPFRARLVATSVMFWVLQAPLQGAVA